MNRKTLIEIHLYLALFFMPFLLMMPITGISYLLGQKGASEQSVVFTVNEAVPKDTRNNWIRTQFEQNNIDFTWEEIKESGDSLILRPSSKQHYVLKMSDGQTQFINVKPNFMLKMIELHKGHGPSWFKILEEAFGVGLLLVSFSGLWLAFGMKAYRKKIVISFALGMIITIVAYFS